MLSVTNMIKFGADSGDPRAGGEWEDEEDLEGGAAQCAQQ
jgi:DnaJ homolog subfamily A member 2